MIGFISYVGITLKTLKLSKAKGINITVTPDTAGLTPLGWLRKSRKKVNPALPSLVQPATTGEGQGHHLAAVVDLETEKAEHDQKTPDRITGLERDHYRRALDPSEDVTGLGVQEIESCVRTT